LPKIRVFLYAENHNNPSTDISERHTLKISEDSCFKNTVTYSDLLHGIRLLKKNLDNVLAAWISEIQ